MENQNTTHKLIIMEWVTIIGVFIGCFLFLHSQISAIDCRLEARMLSQEQRTDRLYEMFIDLVKERKG